MKIALVIPPSPFLTNDKVFPFLGPLQIAAVARDLGNSVKVVDLAGCEEPENVLCKETGSSDVIGFYALAAHYPQVVKLRSLVRDRVTVLGGPHANTSRANCLNDGFDHVIVSDQGGGGGEPGFIQLLNDLPSADPMIRVPSRKPDVTYQNDCWPFPARDLIDLRSYRYFIDGERATSIVSTTGCPFACAFCSHWDGYRQMEMKSPERVQEEIRWIRDRYGWRAFMFYDDEINLRPDFLDGFLPMLKSAGIVWRAFFKSSKVLTTESVFRAMAESGCAQLCTGAESADPQILKAIRKGTSLEDNTNFVRFCIKYGIRPKVFTQVGLPGETPESVEALRSWLIRMASIGLDDVDVTITTPYEGSPIFNDPQLYKIGFNKSHVSAHYKGAPGKYKSHVWHPSLSSDDLVHARQWVEDGFRKATSK